MQWTRFSWIRLLTNAPIVLCRLANVIQATNSLEYSHSLACSADGTRLIAGGVDAIYLSADSGVSWTPATPPGGPWVSVASSAGGATLLATSGGAIYDSTNFGATDKRALELGRSI